jgi:hypothetical protein
MNCWTELCAFSAQIAKVPEAITSFPDEVIRAREARLRKAFLGLIYFHEADHRGCFAAWDEPETCRRFARIIQVFAIIERKQPEVKLRY